ncbi:sel1 repeat family protein [Pseudomonas sp. TH31]|uniref:sel1 repeat family protein n=1 Tax=Pseudomonas sp. TH31 TaxID=2796396 RepID=UPI0019127E39|nr:sel1 repeat family protein [Pseudomonas sp. TH31]
MKIFFVCALLISTSIVNAHAQLSQSQRETKDEGLILHNQYKIAIPELTIAAETGDKEAQFYLAEELRQQKQYITVDARKWYEAAAEQDDLYAMIRLGRSNSNLCEAMNNCPKGKKTPKEWLAKAEAVAKEKADQGDAESLYILYELTADRKLLEQSAHAGSSVAQYRMAIGERQGEGSQLPWKRQKSVEQWFLASAKNGNPKAMMQLFGIYREKVDLEQARYWVEQAALTGYEAGVYNYGYFLAVEPNTLGFTMDPIKGYALISLLKELDGGGTAQSDVEETLPLIAKNMTAEEIEQANKFAQKWKNEHPPLSFYPEKIEF